MTDHIGEATKKVIDLDALEKLADEAMLSMSVKTMRMHKKAVRDFRIFANPWKIKALIAELKEASGLLEPFAREAESWPELADSDTLAMTSPDGTASAYDVTMKDIRTARAFLARNGKGEG